MAKDTKEEEFDTVGVKKMFAAFARLKKVE